jgi:hypothetical protein
MRKVEAVATTMHKESDLSGYYQSSFTEGCEQRPVRTPASLQLMVLGMPPYRSVTSYVQIWVLIRLGKSLQMMPNVCWIFYLESEGAFEAPLMSDGHVEATPALEIDF